MALFILRFWPVLIPLIIYLVWMLRVRRKARIAGAAIPSFREGPWFWAVVASMSLGIAIFVIAGLSHDSIKGDYTPPHMEDGKIVPGKVAP